MKTDELRQKYLDFYVSKGHRLCTSDVLVPRWDKSVLFTPAGMNPFKDHFLGRVALEFTRATSCQKCLRTGDIDNVGRTAYHHTFFEMLGNFSFGDYFKRDAIHWAWEFLTDKKWLGLKSDRLTVTVYLEDDEAAGIWHNDIGLSMDRIQRMDEHDNFWPAGAPSNGPDGVCGPCSEIFYHPPGGGKEVEIWNLVFTQFNREGAPPDNLRPLPSKNIDTGMGLERTVAQIQGVNTNYHIDSLRPIVEAAAEICGLKYDPQSDHGRRLRRITDHVRACTFAVHENVHPGPAKQEYVVRRLLRRAVLDGHQMGLKEPFLFKLVPTVAEMVRQPYPELSETTARVAQVIRQEEYAFLGTLDEGLARIEKTFESMTSANQTTVPGRDAADLYQTFGVPPELFEQMAGERNCQFDWTGFRTAMDEHGQRSGKIADGVMGDFGPIDEIKREFKSTPFVGYDSTKSTAVVFGLIKGQQRVNAVSVDSTSADQIVVLNQSPFYAESGGQVGDVGTIVGPNGTFEVQDTQREGDLIVHRGRMSSGTLNQGDTVEACVNGLRRQAIRRAHSATHVLHYALQKTLGSHAQQRGSKVADDWLRFDFSNMSGVSTEQMEIIEKEVNSRVDSGAVISAEVLPLAAARSKGAMMLFGEKYPDPVRMISIGDFSRELCGGIHAANARDIERVELITEEGVSSGTRRIEALTGEKSRQYREAIKDDAKQLSKLLGVDEAKILLAIGDLAKDVKDLRKQLESGKSSGQKTGSPTVSSKPSSTSDEYAFIRTQLRDAARGLNVSLTQLVGRVESLIAERTELSRKIADAPDAGGPQADDLIGRAERIGDIHLIVQEMPQANAATLRQLVDEIRSKVKPAAIFFATAQGIDKVQLVAGISAELIQKGLSAGQWVKAIAPIVGGGGGGKPDFAQAGGKQPENIKPALHAAAEYLRSSLKV